MRLFTFLKFGETRIGLERDSRRLDLYEAYKLVYGTKEAPGFLLDMKKLIMLGKPVMNVLHELEREWPKEAELTGTLEWSPPVPYPEKILCPAVNYRAHGQEAGTAPPPKPYFFTKFASSLVGHEMPVIRPKVTEKLDWEVELGIVIGKPGKYIEPERALDYVFGFTVFNDVSVRDWQFPEGWPKTLNPYGQNWVWGKAMDRTTPVGPVIVTRDEIGDPNSLSMTLKVNGNIEQNGNTRDLIFNVQQLVSWASRGITLSPGDIISTGTPPGVGFAKGKYLKPGDVMEAIIEGIGTLRNKVEQE
ncbi:putative 2-keto-3-deoxyxylonate dehydratase [Metallosphaera sp. J1]|uniref:fumarylacetoacetate hydrolase family protein n=1 Tax=Metallosphaera TaxID=41980 RepID=UPI001EDD0321|nr:fumarylacetoacetate hydrolase family protein [Metallosphaera javensis (ex Hofmann et al. 2022)]MCG3108306.1 putative 2-keto-3-deoxyxylonate dehydratase [Metallosphaera javensis (ex Hofmann et al. 2022)]BCS93813.1 MAG: 2-hydroxyhepta-2,4-diene-1,7-dioate isomerase [Metallosphaera javensis (ex Sakai et al. 2022)]